MRLPLPFPVRDAGDLRRAIKWLAKHGDDEIARRYVITRAKALGHLDMLPTSWSESMTQRAMNDVSLEKQFAEQSHRHGISVARLKTVYFRGVAEYQLNGLEIGSADMWALVRVQKYINAVNSGDYESCQDSDLCAHDVALTQIADTGVEMNIDSGGIFSSVFYGDCADVASFFHPGVVESVAMHDQFLLVFGSLNDDHWKYRLDTLTGHHTFSFMS